MPSFIFPSIQKAESLNFSEDSFIWIWHADKIPPHIGISTQNRYYSLKVSGKDNGLNCTSVWNLAVKKEIAIVLVKLNQPLELNRIKSKFEAFEITEPNSITCLSPISSILNFECKQLSELLNELTINNFIHSFLGNNLPNGYNQLRDYSTNEIMNRLKLLANA